MNEIDQAAAALRQGHLVAFPTETVYGLGADSQNEQAVARIYATKGRPQNHPLIIHIGSRDSINYFAKDVPEYAIALADKFWPGPMTLILNRSHNAKDFVTGSQESVGLRVPDHPVALSLLSRFHELGGNGVAAPSANRFGKVSPTQKQAVQDEIGELLVPGDLILDGGQSQVGIESTIIDCTGINPRILRPGSITQEMVIEATGLRLDQSESAIRVSGSLESHYSPKASVWLDTEPRAGDGFIALAKFPTPEGVIRLAAPSSNEEFARVLYSSLREADRLGITRVVAHQPEGDGIGLAIRDRLLRASSKS